MRAFRLFLIVFLTALVVYTIKVISIDGFDLFSVFFGDIFSIGWPGQFNFDFLGYLILSALWTAWRSEFTLSGIGLAILAFFFGMGFLTIYLLYLTIKHSGDMDVVLRGARAK